MKPTEHETITGAEANRLPVGSVLLTLSYRADEGIRILDGTLVFPPDKKYLVLHVPAPVSPEVGDTLTREQLETLPQRSVVIDAENGAWQLVGEKWRHHSNTPGAGVDLFRVFKPLMLVWLPTGGSR